MGFVLRCLARATQSTFARKNKGSRETESEVRPYWKVGPTLERSPDRARAVYAPLEKPVSRAVVQRSGQFVLLSRSMRCDVVYTPKRQILSPSR